MSLRENIQQFFKPKEVKETEHLAKVNEALTQERVVTAEYLEGRMSLNEYKQSLAKNYPLTKIDLRKLVSGTGRVRK